MSKFIFISYVFCEKRRGLRYHKMVINGVDYASVKGYLIYRDNKKM